MQNKEPVCCIEQEEEMEKEFEEIYTVHLHYHNHCKGDGYGTEDVLFWNYV